MTNGIRPMARARFFEIVSALGGVVDPERVDALRAVLRGLPVRTLAGFHLALEREMDRLGPAALCHPGGEAAVGDGLRALQLAVIARGARVVDEVARHPDPVVVREPPEHALDLAEIAFETCEERGDEWPLIHTGDFLDDAGDVIVLSVHIEAFPVPQDACSRRVAELLAVWGASRRYADAVAAIGLRAFRCFGSISSEDAGWGPAGTRWSVSQVAGVVEIHFTLDVTELPVRDAAAGERHVRELVDRCARRWGLPGADETLGPVAALR